MKKCFECDERIFYDEINEEWSLRVYSNWNDELDDYDYTELPINFCPECGKDYRKKNAS